MSQPIAADIESLIELFNRSPWDEMHLKIDGLEIFLSNDATASKPGSAVPNAAPAAAPAPVTVASSVTPPPSAAGAHAISIPAGMVAVRAPNLGTFYRAPKPGAPPYVEIGQQVGAETEVCLIEVMKLFTPVRAGVAGTVRQLCVNDGQMVEFEQVLMIVEPSA
jgi:acetyl-CoA carboxylase biotin carboxyl carrier protein